MNMGDIEINFNLIYYSTHLNKLFYIIVARVILAVEIVLLEF